MQPELDPTCPFCRADVQAEAFAESQNFLAVYNISPVLPGHSMVIPRRHLAGLLQLSDAELCEMSLFARDVVKLLAKAFGQAAFDWTIQDGAAAGQTVAHLHLHLIPRKDGDLPQPGDWYPLLEQNENALLDSAARARYDPQAMKLISTKLKEIASAVLPAEPAVRPDLPPAVESKAT